MSLWNTFCVRLPRVMMGTTELRTAGVSPANFCGRTAIVSLALVSLVLIQVLSLPSLAQEQTAPADSPGPVMIPDSNQPLRLQEFEGLALAAIRQQFPRLPGFFASSHSCHLPDYGPLVSIIIQPPSYYFTRPVLIELERRQKIAEEQARRIRTQLDRAAEIIGLKAREAALSERIESERSRKKDRTAPPDLVKDLTEVRQSIASLESNDTDEDSISQVEDSINEVDLNKLMLSNYQQMIQKVTGAVRETLAQNATRIVGLGNNERVCITAHIRDNFGLFGNQERNLVFVLNSSDIQAFQKGTIDLKTLKTRVFVKEDK